MGNIVAPVRTRPPCEAELFQVQLEAAVVAADLAADLDHVSLLEPGGGVGKVVPHAGFDLAGAVAQGKRQVLAAILSAAQLLGGDGEERDDCLVFEFAYIRNVNLFHFARVLRARGIGSGGPVAGAGGLVAGGGWLASEAG